MTVAVNQDSKKEMRLLPKLNFKLRPEEIMNITRMVLGKCVESLDRVGAISMDACTFKSVVWPLAQTERIVGTDLSVVGFLQYVSADAAVRSASVEATKLIDVSLAWSL